VGERLDRLNQRIEELLALRDELRLLVAGVIDRTLAASGRGLLHFIGRDQPAPLYPWIRLRRDILAVELAVTTRWSNSPLRPIGPTAHDVGAHA